MARLTDFYLRQLVTDTPNIFTIHAEIEGMKHLSWFEDFLRTAQSQQVLFVKVEDIAKQYLADRSQIPICNLVQGSVEGRSGTMAVQA